MRFQRNLKIFRGQLDPAPLAGVFFLLLIFIMLGTRALLYTPGVLVQVKDGAVPDDQLLTLTSTGTVSYANRVYQPAELEQLRTDLQNARAQQVLQKIEPGAPWDLREKVRQLLLIQPPPMADWMVGVDSPVIIVAVNLRGQIFYENKLVDETELKATLKERLQAEVRRGKNLKLVLLEDKGVTSEVFVRISSLAAEVGIKEVLLATRPGIFSKTTVPQK